MQCELKLKPVRIFNNVLVKLVLRSKVFNLFIETQTLHSKVFISFSKVTQRKQSECCISIDDLVIIQ